MYTEFYKHIKKIIEEYLSYKPESPRQQDDALNLLVTQLVKAIKQFTSEERSREELFRKTIKKLVAYFIALNTKELINEELLRIITELTTQLESNPEALSAFSNFIQIMRAEFSNDETIRYLGIGSSILFTTKPFERLLGFRHTASFKEHIYKSDVARTNAVMEQIVDTESTSDRVVYCNRYKVLAPQNRHQLVDVQWDTGALFRKEGSVASLFYEGTAQDITEQKEKERLYRVRKSTLAEFPTPRGGNLIELVLQIVTHTNQKGTVRFRNKPVVFEKGVESVLFKPEVEHEVLDILLNTIVDGLGSRYYRNPRIYIRHIKKTGDIQLSIVVTDKNLVHKDVHSFGSTRYLENIPSIDGLKVDTDYDKLSSRFTLNLICFRKLILDMQDLSPRSAYAATISMSSRLSHAQLFRNSENPHQAKIKKLLNEILLSPKVDEQIVLQLKAFAINPAARKDLVLIFNSLALELSDELLIAYFARVFGPPAQDLSLYTMFLCCSLIDKCGDRDDATLKTVLKKTRVAPWIKQCVAQWHELSLEAQHLLFHELVNNLVIRDFYFIPLCLKVNKINYTHKVTLAIALIEFFAASRNETALFRIFDMLPAPFNLSFSPQLDAGALSFIDAQLVRRLQVPHCKENTVIFCIRTLGNLPEISDVAFKYLISRTKMANTPAVIQPLKMALQNMLLNTDQCSYLLSQLDQLDERIDLFNMIKINEKGAVLFIHHFILNESLPQVQAQFIRYVLSHQNCYSKHFSDYLFTLANDKKSALSREIAATCMMRYIQAKENLYLFVSVLLTLLDDKKMPVRIAAAQSLSVLRVCPGQELARLKQSFFNILLSHKEDKRKLQSILIGSDVLLLATGNAEEVISADDEIIDVYCSLLSAKDMPIGIKGLAIAFLDKLDVISPANQTKIKTILSKLITKTEKEIEKISEEDMEDSTNQFFLISALGLSNKIEKTDLSKKCKRVHIDEKSKASPRERFESVSSEPPKTLEDALAFFKVERKNSNRFNVLISFLLLSNMPVFIEGNNLLYYDTSKQQQAFVLKPHEIKILLKLFATTTGQISLPGEHNNASSSCPEPSSSQPQL